MTLDRKPRRPAAIRLDAPDVVVTEAGHEPKALFGRTVITAEPSPAEAGPGERPALPKKRRGPWGRLLMAAMGGLVSLAIGLWADRLIEDLFATGAWLGILGLGLAGLFVVSLGVLIGRELWALSRLQRIERLHEQASLIMARDDREAAKSLARDMLKLYRARPDMARARGELQRHLGDIIDGADLVRLTERALMSELDAQAVQLITRAAKRVSLLTAISPRAVFDIAVVIAQSSTLIRALAELYGARPGGLGAWKLARQVAGHLTITGGMALGDTVVQQLIGHGLAARLSAKLGEGVINGLLTARVGLATLELVRPLPYAALEPPRLNDLAADLARFDRSGKEEVKEQP